MARYYEYMETELASCTTITGILDKSAPFMGWAVKIMAEYLAEHTEEITGNISESRIKEIFAEAKRAYKEKQREAKDIGSRVHEAIDKWLRNEAHDHLVTPDMEKPFWAAVRWAVENNVEVISSEKQVYNPAEEYAGQQDIKGWLNGKVYIIDWKSSKGFYEPEMPLQVAAYSYCEGNEDVEGIGVVRLDKETGMPEFKDYTRFREHYYSMFLHCRDVFYMGYAKKSLRKQS